MILYLEGKKNPKRKAIMLWMRSGISLLSGDKV